MKDSRHGMYFTHFLFGSGLVLFGLGVMGILGSTLHQTTEIIISIVILIVGAILTAYADNVNHKIQKVKSVE